MGKAVLYLVASMVLFVGAVALIIHGSLVPGNWDSLISMGAACGLATAAKNLAKDASDETDGL